MLEEPAVELQPREGRLNRNLIKEDKNKFSLESFLRIYKIVIARHQGKTFVRSFEAPREFRNFRERVFALCVLEDLYACQKEKLISAYIAEGVA